MRGVNIKNLNQVTSRQMKHALEKSQKTNMVKVGLSFVGPGEFIIYEDYNGNKQLGQLIESIDFRDMDDHHQKQSNLDPELIDEMDRFVLVWQFDAHDNISNPKLDTDKYNLVPKDLGEAIPTSKCQYIPENKVQSVAYIFHIDDIQEGKYQPGGMEIAFAVRRIKNKDGRYRKLNNFTSFYDKVCYSKRMWDVTTTIQEYSRRKMSRGGDWNGRYDSFDLAGINEEAYHHFNHIMFSSNNTGELLTINDTKTGKERATKVMHSNLANENKRVRFFSMMTRGLDEPALKRFRGSMGSRIGIANPMPVPKMSDIDNGSKNGLVYLRNNELVRYTTCLPDIIDSEADKQIMPLEVTSIFNKQDGDDIQQLTADEIEDRENAVKKMKQARYVPFPGMDLEHYWTSHGRVGLKMRFKYKKVPASSQLILDLLREGDIAPDEEESFGNAERPPTPLEVNVGDYVRIGAVQFIVDAVDKKKDQVSIRRSIDNGIPAIISMDTAAQLMWEETQPLNPITQ